MKAPYGTEDLDDKPALKLVSSRSPGTLVLYENPKTITLIVREPDGARQIKLDAMGATALVAVVQDWLDNLA